MNTAVRTMNSVALPFANVKTMVSNTRFWLMSFLLGAIFISSLGVIYTQAVNRLLFNDLQAVQRTTDNLRVEWGQLLVEQNTWATPARVEQIAQQKLAMAAPAQSSIVMITE